MTKRLDPNRPKVKRKNARKRRRCGKCRRSIVGNGRTGRCKPCSMLGNGNAIGRCNPGETPPSVAVPLAVVHPFVTPRAVAASHRRSRRRSRASAKTLIDPRGRDLVRAALDAP